MTLDTIIIVVAIVVTSTFTWFAGRQAGWSRALQHRVDLFHKQRALTDDLVRNAFTTGWLWSAAEITSFAHVSSAHAVARCWADRRIALRFKQWREWNPEQQLMPPHMNEYGLVIEEPDDAEEGNHG